MAKKARKARRQPTPQCVVCQRGDPQGIVHLCDRCWHKYEVRSYCSRCHGRTAQEPEQAQQLFAQLNDDQLQAEELEAGMVIHFLDYCPLAVRTTKPRYTAGDCTSWNQTKNSRLETGVIFILWINPLSFNETIDYPASDMQMHTPHILRVPMRTANGSWR